jgi:Nif-specific regulatory protein
MTNLLLIVREPSRPPFTHPLRHGLRVGRHSDNDLVLESTRVSRQHAQFSISGGRVFISDLGSTHGIWVRGERVRTSRQVFVGEEIRLGDVLFVLADAAQAARAIGSGSSGSREGTVPPTPVRDDALDLARTIDTALATDTPEAVLDLIARAACFAVEGDQFVWARLRADGTTEAHPEGDAVPGPSVTERLLAEPLLDFAASTGIASSVGAPLRAAEQVFGYLYITEARRYERFSPRDRDRVAAYAALGARLYEEALRRGELRHVVARLLDGIAEPIVGGSPAVVRLRERVAACARERERGHLLVVGPPGSGRRHVARAVHALSPQPAAFVEVTCGTFALVGEGVDAGQAMRELVARVGPGTLLLDEIGTLPPSAQAALLAIIEDTEQPDVRLFATSRPPPDPLAAATRLAPQLAARFSMIIDVPPLAARLDDVAPLASHFLSRVAARVGRRLAFDDDALRWLTAQRWPGEIAELRGVAEVVARDLLPDPAAHFVETRHLEEAVRGPAVA